MAEDRQVATADGARGAQGARGARPRLDTFIFDLDGTLLDTLPDLVELTNTALREQGFPERSVDEIHSFVGGGAEMLIRLAVPEGTSEERFNITLQRWRDLYPSIGIRYTKPYPHMIEALRELKRRGVRLGVLSNKFDQGVKETIGIYMPGIFEVLHGECDYIPRKPDPTGILYTMRELDGAPERTAYVGDSRNDAATSRRAGTFTISAAWGYTDGELLRAVEPDAVIEDPLELLQFAPAPAEGGEPASAAPATAGPAAGEGE